MMTPDEASWKILELMESGASKEELYSVIDDFKAGEEGLYTDMDRMCIEYKFKEPLTNMTTEERCRFFARKLINLAGEDGKGSTEFEEALVFKDAADEIKTSNGIIETQLYLISQLRRDV